jgi:hypothetical protein
MLERYDVTPEMLLYRFSELIPQFFGLRLHFMRFHDTNGGYKLIKQLSMNQVLVPSGIGLYEHFCRRWLSVRLLQEMDGEDAPKTSEERPLAGAQLSEFLDSGEQFLSIGFARPLATQPDVNSSVVVGFPVDEHLQKVVGFWDDPALARDTINETCERCPLTPEQCAVRGAEPTYLQEQDAERERQQAMKQLAAQVSG